MDVILHFREMELMDVLKIVVASAEDGRSNMARIVNFRECVYEGIHNNVAVLGKYVVNHEKEHARANFLPTVSIKVPLWLVVALKKREKCTIGPPEWIFSTNFWLIGFEQLSLQVKMVVLKRFNWRIHHHFARIFRKFFQRKM